MIRKEISRSHPVIGAAFRLLKDSDRLRATDETACVSTLLSLKGDEWVSVAEEWKDDLGRTVGEILGPDSKDADCDERLFRRRL